jgi:hypothetical protein
MPSRVHTLTVAVLLMVGIPIISLSAKSRNAALGTWKLNVAKSKYEPGSAPKEQTLTYEAAGRAVRVTSQSIDARGNNILQYSATYDGQDYPVSGGVDSDTTSLKRIDANTMERPESSYGRQARQCGEQARILRRRTRAANARHGGHAMRGRPSQTLSRLSTSWPTAAVVAQRIPARFTA